MSKEIRIPIQGYQELPFEDPNEARKMITSPIQKQGNIDLQTILSVSQIVIEQNNFIDKDVSLKDEANSMLRKFITATGSSEHRSINDSRALLFYALFIEKHISDHPNKNNGDLKKNYEGDVRWNSATNIFYTFGDLKEWGAEYLKQAYIQSGKTPEQAESLTSTTLEQLAATMESSFIPTKINLGKALERGLSESGRSGEIKKALLTLPKEEVGAANGDVTTAFHYLVGAKVSGDRKLESYATDLLRKVLGYGEDKVKQFENLSSKADQIAASARSA